MTLMKVSNDICESQWTKHKISVITITQNAKWYQKFRENCLDSWQIFFSLLTMPPQGQTQGLSYKDQDQDQDLGGKYQDKDKD